MKWTHVARTVWNALVNWVRQESAAASALVLAFIALGIAFSWWQWTNAQIGAVFGIVSALLAMFVRSQVTPVARNRPARRLAATGPGVTSQPAPGHAGRPPGGFQGGTQAGPPDWPDPPAGPGTRPL